MVFKQKLPGAVPRPRLSAQELARELNVLVTVVWDALKSVGEFVDSPRKKVIGADQTLLALAISWRRRTAEKGCAGTRGPSAGWSPQ